MIDDEVCSSAPKVGVAMGLRLEVIFAMARGLSVGIGHLKASADISWALAVDDNPGVRSVKAKVYAGDAQMFSKGCAD